MIATTEKQVKEATIATFPEFSVLDIAHKPQIDAIISRFQPYADFTFVNLFTWSLNDLAEVSTYHGNLIVRFPDYITGKVTYSIIGDNKIDETMAGLFQLTDCLNLVPEVVVGSLRDASRYVLTEDRDGHDYIYDLDAIANLHGQHLKNKRNKLNKFIATYGGKVETRTLTTIDEQTADEIRRLFKRWATGTNKTCHQYEAERIAIDRLLTYIDQLNVLFMIVWIDGEMCAFSVNEVLDDGRAICHYEKALPGYDGAYTFVINYAAKELRRLGCGVVNWEQDLGLPGLRTAKTSYHPIGFLKKFSVTLA
jgi:hypothetical protein